MTIKDRSQWASADLNELADAVVVLQAASGAVSSSAITLAVAQTAHGLTVGNAVRYNGSAWVKAEADVASDADVDGLVSVVADANNFTIALPGPYVTGLSGLTAGNDYFLDPASAGGATATEPTTAGQVSAPIYKALSTTTAIFKPQRGLVIPAAATITKEFVLLADGTALATGEDFASYAYEIGADLDGWSLTGAVWTVKTVSSSGVPSLGLRKNSTEMLSTSITIDANETSSRTAATPAVIKSDGSQTVAAGNLLHFDCDVAGTGTKGSEVRTTWTSP